MTNFGAKILGNAISGLAAQQAIIASTGNNIANVNTPGYSRRIVELLTRSSNSNGGGLEIGNGVEIGNIRRVNDSFLERAVREAAQDRGSYDIQQEFMSRLEPLFTLDGSRDTVGSTLTRFFSAADDLASNPGSIELRANFIARANDLVSNIRTTFGTIANLQAEADTRLGAEIGAVNTTLRQIAQLNDSIRSTEASGINEGSDDRDRRDELLKQLGEKITFNSRDNSDGTLTISLANGFDLVSGGNVNALEVTKTPSFASSPQPPSLSGGILSSIVFNFGDATTPSHLDLTQILKQGQGSVGGLLQLRGFNAQGNTSAFDADGTLVAIGQRIEGVTRALLSAVNTTYLGPDRDVSTATVHEASSGDLNGNSPTSAYALFDFNFSGIKDVDSNGLPDDLDTVTGVTAFSSLLTVGISDPRSVAAALDSSSGPPAAAQFAPGDGRNMLAIAALRNTPTTFSSGSYSITGTYDDAYNETVTLVGNTAATARLNSSVAQSRFDTAASQRDEVSAVSLDEEFTKLIQAQKSYQASARMIKIAADLLDEIVRLI